MKNFETNIPNVSSEQQHSPFLPLPSYEGISLAWEMEQRRNVLILNPETEYPRTGPDSNWRISDMLLSEVENSTDGRRRLLVPDNFVTLGQALNDITNATASGNASDIGGALFYEIGHELAEVAIKDKLVPHNLSYQNFIFSREQAESRPLLLPPIRLDDLSEGNISDIRRLVTKSLLDSCMEGADNLVQQEVVPKWVNSFSEGYRW